PPEWEGFQVTRRFRGAAYAIEVRNPNHVSCGVAEVRLDGQAIAGNRLPILGDGRVHVVEVVMGGRRDG
ncbi:MAG: hypothetical protein QME94_14615, partial [Anaerolineae bacterium]|nr:hypothetical protein [Anaerolineae bacterium]